MIQTQQPVPGNAPSLTGDAFPPAVQQSPQLDPSVVALTKAIGKAESGGNYKTPVGKAGEIGAYQMTPAFIKEYAPKYGIDPSNFDQVAQDKLAYSVIKDWGTQGDPNYPHLGKLSPAQIASAWNTGDPNAYLDPNYGKNNAYGSTQKYVENIQKNYEQSIPNQGGNAPPPTDTSSSQTPGLDKWLWGLGGAAIGGLGWLAGHVGGAAKVALPLVGMGVGEALGGPPGATVGRALGGGIGAYLGSTAASLIPGETPQGGQSTQTGTQSEQPTNYAQMLESQMSGGHAAAAHVAQTQVQAMEGTPSGRVLLQDPQVQEAITTNAKYGLSPETDENGAMDFSSALKRSNDMVTNMSQSVAAVLAKEGEKGNIVETVNHAKNDIEKNRMLLPQEKEEAIQHVIETANSYQRQYGDKGGGIGLEHFQTMKQQLGHRSKWNILDTNAKKAAFKAMSRGARKTIEGHTKHKDFYNAFMKEEQKLIHGQKIMERLNGKRAPHNEGLMRKLIQEGGRGLSAYVGNKIGGPLGAVIGYLMGRHIVKAADKRYGKTIFETPGMRHALALLQKDSPDVHRIIEDELKKAGINQDEKREAMIKVLVDKASETSRAVPPNKTNNHNRGRNQRKQESKHQRAQTK